jgi:hypothetical protein
MPSQPPTAPPTSTSDISEFNQKVLEDNYAKLMSSGSDMIQGLASDTGEYPDTYRAGLMVDFLISGVMGHLQVLASNEAAHADEFKRGNSTTPNFMDYANWLVGQVIQDFPPKPLVSGSDATAEVMPQNPKGV